MSDTCLTVYAHMFVETLILSTCSSVFLSLQLSFYSIISQKLFSGHLPLPSKTCQISHWKKRLKELISEMSKEIKGKKKKDRKRESDH